MTECDLQREILPTFMRRSKKWLIGLAACVALLFAGWQIAVYRHHIAMVPEAMGVWRVLYASEESWGFGPGGNEVGIVVYDMPEEVAEKLTPRGLEYLKTISRRRADGDWRGFYAGWRPTLVDLDERWVPSKPESVNRWQSPGIGDYLSQYGFTVLLREDVERLANDALLNLGSFYAYGRVGMIVLIPSKLRIIYAYSG